MMHIQFSPVLWIAALFIHWILRVLSHTNYDAFIVILSPL